MVSTVFSNVKALIKTVYIFSQPFQYNITEVLIYQDLASLYHQKNDLICYLSSRASFFIHFFTSCCCHCSP